MAPSDGGDVIDPPNPRLPRRIHQQNRPSIPNNPTVREVTYLHPKFGFPHYILCCFCDTYVTVPEQALVSSSDD